MIRPTSNAMIALLALTLSPSLACNTRSPDFAAESAKRDARSGPGGPPTAAASIAPMSLHLDSARGLRYSMRETETFSTASDNQNQIEISVARGRARMFTDNVVLGRFEVHGVPRQPRGKPIVTVTFRADGHAIILGALESTGSPLAIVRLPMKSNDSMARNRK